MYPRTTGSRLCSLAIAVILLLSTLLMSAGCDAYSQDIQVQEDLPEGISPDFKATMDSYEAFFDEYCAFMENYKESGNSIGMLSDYLRFMTRYAETMERLEAMDDGSLSDAELAYYTEVMLRITEKLYSII